MKRLANQWGLILGGSSGLGLASAKKLASEGMNLVIIHRDRRGAMPVIEEEFAAVRAHGHELVTFNQDALNKDVRSEILREIFAKIPSAKFHIVLHSIASGNLKPLAPLVGEAEPTLLLDEEDMAQTIYNMGSSLLFWVQDLHRATLLAHDCRVLGLTSEGNQIAWPGYAAVSAAKGTLETLARNIAKEFAPHGVRCNVIQAGLTDTKALRMIPDHEAMMERALARNPMGRLTTPEDVAGAVFLLALPESRFINGALLRVDGGEAIS